MRGSRKRTLAAFAGVGLFALTASCGGRMGQTETIASAGATATVPAPTVANLVGTWVLDTDKAHPNNPSPSTISPGLGVGHDKSMSGLLIFDGTQYSFILMGDDNPTYNPNPSSLTPASPKIDRRSEKNNRDHAKGIIAYWGANYSVSMTTDGNGFYTLTLPLSDHSYSDFLQIPGYNPQTRLIQYSTSNMRLEFKNPTSSTGAASDLFFIRLTPPPH
jgi:hypothetical protein